MVEVGAGIELDLIADHRLAEPWPAGALAEVTVSTWPSSTSVSLARTSTRIGWHSRPRIGVGVGHGPVIGPGDRGSTG